MPRACLIALFPAALVATAPAAAQQAASVLSLAEGEQRTIVAPSPPARVVMGTRGVVRAIGANGNRLRIAGLKAGRTAMTLESASGDAIARYDITVTGEEGALARRLREEPGLGSVDVRRAGETVILAGNVADKESRQRARDIARAYAGDKVSDLTAVTGGQMVAVDVKFAAVSASTLRALGFSFAKLGGDIQGAITGPNAVNTLSLPNPQVPAPFDLGLATPIQSAFNLFLSNPRHGVTGMLSALSSAGLSEILAQPTLLVRSGDQASFLAGGEVPVPVPQGGNAGGTVAIDYREFGVRLDVTADVLSNRRIVLKLSPEVSELDYANGVRMQGYVVPGLRRRSTSTTIELGSGQSFVIAGLTYSTGGRTTEKLPLLGDIPVIGALFRRSQKSGERQELIVIATPRLVDPLDPANAPPLPEAKDVEQRLSADFGLMGR